jgi:lipopolysaccharide export system protein LptC
LKLIQERPNAPLMTITAKRGRVSGDRKNVDLHDDVVAVRQGCREAGLNCSDEPMTLSTDYLNIKPDERLMTSDRTVTITSPTGVVHSVGIVLDDAKRTIHLESNVRGTFESRPTPNATSKQR